MKPFWQFVSMGMLSLSMATLVYAATDTGAGDSITAHDLKLISFVFLGLMGVFGLEARVSKRIVAPTALSIVSDEIKRHLETDHKTLMEKLDELIHEIRADRDHSGGELKALAERISRIEGACTTQHGGKS